VVQLDYGNKLKRGGGAAKKVNQKLREHLCARFAPTDSVMMNQQRTTSSTPTALLTFTQSSNVLIYICATQISKAQHKQKQQAGH
jgi:hypothetical protein